ncbi:uncharacterized protein LOC104583932 [Brachypodium distachyon]|uniref:F-box domain-containing protein n=1 Tax=Brachypodium distachyon TaxID=15368 RepID=A0A0Q3F1A0_BRADI|nr:uncharacterized protein LOC104583932 [Brachypodium distachyon]KQJ93335.1 hypothetical protein BRADI_3g03915v3 [Brachypodium distachyon]|eukprot:XP_010236267.1 uncharacterized protein LOC104583932 [Brachypodium distachyon]
MAAPPPNSDPGGPPESPFFQVPDELLREIFLLLPTAADLARATTSCASFHRVIADHKFLRCYRALHPPPLVGAIGSSLVTAQPPHPSAAAARAFADFDFSDSYFQFVPSSAGRCCWRRLHFFEGRALLTATAVDEGKESKDTFRDVLYRDFLARDLAVCDPVHRRYVLLPAVPADLTALIYKPDFLDEDTFLAPGEDEDDPLSFRVMCLVQCRMKLVLLVFSSSLGGHWCALTFDRSNAQAVTSLLQCEPDLPDRQYLHGRFYWELSFSNQLLALDVRVMEFSAVDLPPEQPDDSFVIVEAVEGMLGMFTLRSEDEAYWLTYSILRNNQWQSEKVIPIPLLINHCHPMGVAGGYLLIQSGYTISSEEKRDVRFFSVDIKTWQVELFAGPSKVIFPSHLYSGFPPSLCAPTI